MQKRRIKARTKLRNYETGMAYAGLKMPLVVTQTKHFAAKIPGLIKFFDKFTHWIKNLENI